VVVFFYIMIASHTCDLEVIFVYPSLLVVEVLLRANKRPCVSPSLPRAPSAMPLMQGSPRL
jgi:hypothetical protein